MDKLTLCAETLLDDLGNDEAFANKVTTFQERIQKVNACLLDVQSARAASDLSEDDRIQLDLCQLYTVNTLYFVYLKLQGTDVTNHPIKGELARVREAMKRHKLVKEKPHPRVDKAAAARFVRSGLWDPTQQASAPPNKRIKFQE